MNSLNPRQIKIAQIIGAAVLLIVLITDLLMQHHAHFERDGIEIDTMPGFFPEFGLLAAFAFVILARSCGIALKRKDSYYVDD